jgi:hypothetical protein
MEMPFKELFEDIHQTVSSDSRLKLNKPTLLTIADLLKILPEVRSSEAIEWPRRSRESISLSILRESLFRRRAHRCLAETRTVQ